MQFDRCCTDLIYSMDDDDCQTMHEQTIHSQLLLSLYLSNINKLMYYFQKEFGFLIFYFLPRFFLTFSGSTLVPTSGQLKSISPNVESKVQQMMRLAGVQQMGHLDGDSREITKDQLLHRTLITTRVRFKLAWLPGDHPMSSTQKPGT